MLPSTSPSARFQSTKVNISHTTVHGRLLDCGRMSLSVTVVVLSTKSQIPLHYLVADRSEAGRRPAASWNLAYHLTR